MSEHGAESGTPTRVSELPPFKELRVYRDPNVPAPLVICRVCGAAVLDSYALVHRSRCVISSA